MHTLTLPMPPSANRCWRTSARGGKAITYISDTAKSYRAAVALAYAVSYGFPMPQDEPIRMTIEVYPQRPKDWAKRLKAEGPLWHRSVRSLDLDNHLKVLCDALIGIAYVDDKQVLDISIKRRPPTGKARCIVTWEEIE